MRSDTFKILALYKSFTYLHEVFVLCDFVGSDHASVGKLLRLSTSAATAATPQLTIKHVASDDDFL